MNNLSGNTSGRNSVLLICILLFVQLCFVAADKLGETHGNRKLQAVSQPVSVMDEILAINSRRRDVLNNPDNSKRSDIEEKIIEANNVQEVSDDLFEGDVILDPDTIPEDKELYDLQMKKKNETSAETADKRQGTRNLKWLWHYKQVPFQISPNLFQVQHKILKAIRTFNSKTCVKFVPRKRDDKNYVLFDKRQGCYSRIGRSYARRGPQVISIGQYCDFEGIIHHEMLHSVGFYHEQSRPDRKKHIEIHWENVKPGFENEFLQYSHGKIDNLQINYNYQSLLHYGANAFSKAMNRNTITAIGTSKKVQLGNLNMSSLDVIELDALYRCKSNKVNEWTPWSSYSPCDKHCYKNRQRFCYGKTPTSCGGKPNPYGVDSQYVKCSSDECPLKIDGNWGAWSPWSACSHSCDEGKKLRTRKCNNPKPQNKGKPCKGSSKSKILCVQPRCHLDPDDTDFRHGSFGMWQNDIYDTPGLNWIIGKGNTPTEGTGPHSDHTTKKDFYLYVESSGRRENDVARLVSQFMLPTSPNKKCFRFFYHMFGRTVGSLTVRLIPKDEQQQVLFTKQGSQSGQWQPAELTLKTTKPYQLVFEATLGKPPYSDIAIDDVFIDDGSCDCKDKYLVCNYWKKGGYCKKSFAYMYSNCPKSCNFCGCEDNPRWNCKRWSLKECKKNPVWMEVNCPVTCQACGCYDRNVWCHVWKNSGQCEKNPDYMKLYCRKACEICT